MTVYLHDVPLNKAQETFQNALMDNNRWGILGIEEITLDEKALGRFLAKPVWAKISSPHYHASAMDGFALKASDTEEASEKNPICFKISENAVYVDTGDPIPEWSNCVYPVEIVDAFDKNDQAIPNVHEACFIRIRSSSAPWKHIRTMGEDIIATQLVLPAGHQIRPVDLGAIAASGHALISVTRKPVVTIIPTGTELVSIGHKVKSGDIIEFNSIVLAAQINSWGGTSNRWEMVKDNFDEIKAAVQKAAFHSDLILLNAGSSAGSEDFSASVVQSLGDLLVHGVAVKPGHPVILGMIRQNLNQKEPGLKIPIIGVPGYPVSAALTGEIFVKPILKHWIGDISTEPQEISAKLTRKVTSPAGDDDYMRVIVGRVAGELKAAPISRGAGVITSLVRADGIVKIPRSIQGMEAGSEVKVSLYRDRSELEKTILVIGSHDMTLDLLAQHLKPRDRRMVSANVGSLGGLIALNRGEAHIAGSHLLDPKSGEYNIAYVRQYLPNLAVKIITWAERQQGLIVQKNNPKKIHSINDLLRCDISFINRQRGSGTRILLDFHLEKLGIPGDRIRGYRQEEFTHLNVAAAVASNRADCGLGIAAAAAALNLDFIPLFNERYDLIIPCQYIVEGLITPLFDVMQDDKFRNEITSIDGYIFDKMGDVILDCEDSTKTV